MKKIAILLLLFFSFSFGDTRQFQGNGAHTGYTGDSVVCETLLLQKRLADSINYSSGPVTFNQFVFTPTISGFWCLTTSGDSLWSQPGKYYGVPAIIGNNKVVVAKAETLVCFSFQGECRWSLIFPNIPSHPTVVGENIFLTCQKKVYAINSTGHSLWVTSDLHPGFTRNIAVAVKDSWIFAATIGEVIYPWYAVIIYQISPRGNVIWSQGYGLWEGGNQTTPTIGIGGSINVSSFYLSGFSNCVRNVIPGSSNSRWEQMGCYYYASAATHESLVFWSGERLRAFHIRSGQEIWSFNSGQVSYSSPIISTQGHLYFGNDNGDFFCVDARTGLLRFSFHCSNTALTNPASTSDGKIIICDIEGNIYCFGPRTVGITEKPFPQIQSRIQTIYSVSNFRVPAGYILYDKFGRKIKTPLISGIYFLVKENENKIVKIVKKVVIVK